MRFANGAQFLNITPLFVLSARLAAAAYPAPAIFIVPLISIYESAQSHKLDFSIVVLNLISLLVLYSPLASSFISTQFFALNLDG